MPNKSTQRGLELKKTALAIPYHNLTNKNDFRAILGYLFKIFKKIYKNTSALLCMPWQKYIKML